MGRPGADRMEKDKIFQVSHGEVLIMESEAAWILKEATGP